MDEQERRKLSKEIKALPANSGPLISARVDLEELKTQLEELFQRFYYVNDFDIDDAVEEALALFFPVVNQEAK